jgi:hypothetical protein
MGEIHKGEIIMPNKTGYYCEYHQDFDCDCITVSKQLYESLNGKTPSQLVEMGFGDIETQMIRQEDNGSVTRIYGKVSWESAKGYPKTLSEIGPKTHWNFDTKSWVLDGEQIVSFEVLNTPRYEWVLESDNGPLVVGYSDNPETNINNHQMKVYDLLEWRIK